MTEPRMSLEELRAFVEEHFPAHAQAMLRIEAVGPRHVRVRLHHREEHLRPGGTVSGPALMALADAAVYFALIATIGPAVHAVTANLNIHFLKRPGPADVLADARLHKVGRRLAVGEATMYSEGAEDEPVAVATVTYSVPEGRAP